MAPHYQILAIDLDGTLLDPDGNVAPETRAELARLEARGTHVLLCTGRRFRRAAQAARAAAIDTPLVCNSGALVKCPRSQQTLFRADFDASTSAAVLDLFDQTHDRAVLFQDNPDNQHDFLVARFPGSCNLFNDYVAANKPHARIDPNWPLAARAGSLPLFHVCAIGTREQMVHFAASAHARLDGQIQTFVQTSPRYEGWMCELLRRDANKWTAVRHLAEVWNIDPSRICAVGDDANDQPMIKAAGLGAAMSHAPEDVRAAAKIIIDSARPGALVEFLQSIP